ncbi:hypothetical protein Syun_011856 [Stephania yunnanensis]|uniref:Replication protein A 70 kDa DNA-binding subunit B/D first OB fold domain-containing protein n=1 Tax=Stephania yunnanensis TaxID=152371 RepID=A0AAP0JYJ0_9MAGN
MEYTMLDDLQPTREDWAVRVRISRLWESQNLRNDNEVISLDMILIDEHFVMVGVSPSSSSKPRKEKIDDFFRTVRRLSSLIFLKVMVTIRRQKGIICPPINPIKSIAYTAPKLVGSAKSYASALQ